MKLVRPTQSNELTNPVVAHAKPTHIGPVYFPWTGPETNQNLGKPAHEPGEVEAQKEISSTLQERPEVH